MICDSCGGEGDVFCGDCRRRRACEVCRDEDAARHFRYGCLPDMADQALERLAALAWRAALIVLLVPSSILSLIGGAM